MNFYTSAIFTALFFCMFSGLGEEIAEGFGQNPEYIIPSSAPEKPAEEKQPVQTVETNHWEKPAEPGSRSSASNDNYNPHRGTAYLRRNNPPNGIGSNDNTPNTPWVDQELKNWESRQNPVPSALPRVTDFHPKTSGSFGNINKSRNYYRKISEKNGKTIIRVKNHR